MSIDITPGDWSIDPLDPCHVVNYADGRMYSIAETNNNQKPESEQQGNALLLSRAKVMREALLTARSAVVFGSQLERANALKRINDALRGIE